MIAKLIERRPELGYLSASLTSLGSWVSFAEDAKLVLGLATGVVSLAVGVYTLRIQIRAWKRGDANVGTTETGELDGS
jgi:hypothetical protein